MKKCGSCQGVGLGMPHLFRVIVVGGWGGCNVEGHSLSVCLFAFRLVDYCLR